MWENREGLGCRQTNQMAPGSQDGRLPSASEGGGAAQAPAVPSGISLHSPSGIMSADLTGLLLRYNLLAGQVTLVVVLWEWL